MAKNSPKLRSPGLDDDFEMARGYEDWRETLEDRDDRDYEQVAEVEEYARLAESELRFA